MPRKKPETKRCLAENRDGTRCKRPAREGGLCHTHAKKLPAASPTSAWMMNLGEEGQRRLEALQQDPDLLDPRRPFALQSLLTEQIAIPSENLIRHRAKLVAVRAARELGAKNPERARVKPEHEEEARRVLVRESIAALVKLGDRQDKAVRNTQVFRVLVGQIVPLWEDLLMQMMQSLDRHVPGDATRKLIHRDLEVAFRGFIARATAVGEDVIDG